MYKLSLRRSFIARHFLFGGDWGAENYPNSHQYLLELQLEGPQLDQHGYLYDIVEVEKYISQITGYYAEKMLNDLPEFEGLNPSLENFARIICSSLAQLLKSATLAAIEVRLWENETAWAAYRVEF